ncbi:MAG: GNAT family acetyltransferase [Pelagibacteraceae bacterium]|nr:MAG: GNAT family acetyltransferase [Pelagibacteraceae bacterium]
MERSIDRFYLHLLSSKDLIKSTCKEKNLEILLEKKPTVDICKFFYREVGKNFFWRDRLKWNDANWMDYINKDLFKLYILKSNNKLAGYYELLYNPINTSMEIAYFGIFKEFFGKGIGGYLLTDAILSSFKQKINKVWVHTCTLDHPNALKNYLARGMTTFKTEKIIFNPDNL